MLVRWPDIRTERLRIALRAERAVLAIKLSSFLVFCFAAPSIIKLMDQTHRLGQKFRIKT
jgi:hypothetical protein